MVIKYGRTIKNLKKYIPGTRKAKIGPCFKASSF